MMLILLMTSRKIVVCSEKQLKLTNRHTRRNFESFNIKRVVYIITTDTKQLRKQVYNCEDLTKLIFFLETSIAMMLNCRVPKNEENL
jgi:hypothetical protein